MSQVALVTVRGSRALSRKAARDCSGNTPFALIYRKRWPELAPASVPGARWLPLTKRRFALVDEGDFEAASRLMWQLVDPRDGNTGYAKTATYPPELEGKQKPIKLHRFIWGLHGNAPVPRLDHRNGDGLDCRFQNLRSATSQQNCANSAVSKNCRSGFKGVRQGRGSQKWTAQIGVGWRSVYLGTFTDKIEAARAYDRAAIEHFGEFARLNFPIESAVRHV